MNQYCVVIGKVGSGPLGHIGPYPDEESAHAALKEYPAGWVDILIDPQVIKEGPQPDGTPRTS